MQFIGCSSLTIAVVQPPPAHRNKHNAHLTAQQTTFGHTPPTVQRHSKRADDASNARANFGAKSLVVCAPYLVTRHFKSTPTPNNVPCSTVYHRRPNAEKANVCTVTSQTIPGISTNTKLSKKFVNINVRRGFRGEYL